MVLESATFADTLRGMQKYDSENTNSLTMTGDIPDDIRRGPVYNEAHTMLEQRLLEIQTAKIALVRNLRHALRFVVESPAEGLGAIYENYEASMRISYT